MRLQQVIPPVAAIILMGCQTTTPVKDPPVIPPDPCPSEVTAELGPPPKSDSTEEERALWIGVLVDVTDADRAQALMEYYLVTLPGYAQRLYTRMVGAKKWCADPKRR